MSAKDTIIADKQKEIQELQNDIAQLNQMEIGRVYKIAEKDWAPYTNKPCSFESWGYIECFNKESVRFCIIASDNPRYGRTRWRGRRANVASYNYYNLFSRLTRARRDDLPLLVGMKIKSVELEMIFKGRKKVKLDV